MKKDLIILAADKDARFVLDGILSRYNELKIREVDYDIFSKGHDPWVYKSPHDVGKNISRKPDKNQKNKRPQNYRVVALDNGIISQKPHARNVAGFLDKERTREQEAERVTYSGCYRDKRIPHRVDEYNPALGQSLGKSCADVIGAQIIQQ